MKQQDRGPVFSCSGICLTGGWGLPPAQVTQTMVVQPDDPRLQKVGFAKLEGPGIDFYAKNYEITIGRKSKSTKLDVVLGKPLIPLIPLQPCHH